MSWWDGDGAASGIGLALAFLGLVGLFGAAWLVWVLR